VKNLTKSAKNRENSKIVLKNSKIVLFSGLTGAAPCVYTQTYYDKQDIHKYGAAFYIKSA